jgi:hypothetical protein
MRFSIAGRDPMKYQQQAAPKSLLGVLATTLTQTVSAGSKSHSELWVAPTSGGVARKVADAPGSHPRLGEIAWHPGGTMIFASGGPEETQPKTYEHWAMENFLPETTAVK